MMDGLDELFREAEGWIDGDWPKWAKRVQEEGYRRRLHGDSLAHRIVARIISAGDVKL